MLGRLIYRKFSHFNLRRWKECVTLINWLEPKSGERVLDIGCGDGWWSQRIAARGAQVVGVDINERGLAVARQRNSASCCEYLYMNAEKATFPDGHFDKAISMCVVEHFRDENAVLRNLARALKPGARFVLSADSLTNPEIRPSERDLHRQRYAVNTFYTIELLRDKLDQAGFDLEEAQYILTTPFSLMLARMSWRLDNLCESPRKALAVAGELCRFMLDFSGRIAIEVGERFFSRENSGLTILARARRRSNLCTSDGSTNPIAETQRF